MEERKSIPRKLFHDETEKSQEHLPNQKREVLLYSANQGTYDVRHSES